MPNNFLEKSLEDIIYENNDEIHSRGLSKFKNTTFRQFELPSGKKIDLITYSLFRGSISVDIYELKKEQIDTATVYQLYNYAHEFLGMVSDEFQIVNIKLVLVGKAYQPISILEAVNLPIEIYTYEYAMTGIVFTKQSSSPKSFSPNNPFVNALIAFGTRLSFPEGQPKVMNILNQYLDYLKNNPEYDHEIETVKKEDFTIKPQLLLPSTSKEYDSEERISYAKEYRDFDEGFYETDE